ncbi:glycosyltransferase family 2 protein, partial [Salmonella enterica]|nr:glycosyltransferase family 2 protein [Salmonella enterica]EFS8220284.1 glycosyltransferase family 2 protein [Salmonella enterica subsp. enterica serovar Soerenga]EHM5563480.1 glycosyltransferase family 2 protein [Salmonella enterica subsp. enterica serovar Urbana]ECQ2947034.1 glycosyltransferase family 2 protein [Salmonella enterica]ECR8505313.1 glycosyltransferase family 2 protein [Salmonella enterica]
MNREIVSVIMPVYNGSHTIVDSIESVLNQTYKDIKLYVIDDCSTDDTAKLLTVNYANNKNVKIIISSKNKGVAASRNLGIKESKGKYIAFCDADDLWENNKIE